MKEKNIEKMLDAGMSVFLLSVSIMVFCCAIVICFSAYNSLLLPIQHAKVQITALNAKTLCSWRIVVDVDGQNAAGCYSQHFWDGLKLGQTVLADYTRERITGRIDVEAIKTLGGGK